MSCAGAALGAAAGGPWLADRGARPAVGSARRLRQHRPQLHPRRAERHHRHHRLGRGGGAGNAGRDARRLPGRRRRWRGAGVAALLPLGDAADGGAGAVVRLPRRSRPRAAMCRRCWRWPLRWPPGALPAQCHQRGYGGGGGLARGAGVRGPGASHGGGLSFPGHPGALCQRLLLRPEALASHAWADICLDAGRGLWCSIDVTHRCLTGAPRAPRGGARLSIGCTDPGRARGRQRRSLSVRIEIMPAQAGAA